MSHEHHHHRVTRDVGEQLAREPASERRNEYHDRAERDGPAGRDEYAISNGYGAREQYAGRNGNAGRAEYARDELADRDVYRGRGERREPEPRARSFRDVAAPAEHWRGPAPGAYRSADVAGSAPSAAGTPSVQAAPAPASTVPDPRVQFSIGRRNLQLLGAGAVGAVAFLLLSGNSEKLKPALAAALKEAYGMKEWLLAKSETIAADLQDAAAEAKHASEHEKDLEKLLEALIDDDSLQQKLREILERKTAKHST